MFSKLFLAVLVAPLISALTLNAPTNVTSASPFTVTWVHDDSEKDLNFTLFLNHPTFGISLAIANNVLAQNDNLTVSLQPVPDSPGYTLMATVQGNILDVLSTSPPFPIRGDITVSFSSTTTGPSTSVSPRATTTSITRLSSSTTVNGGLGSATDTSSPVPTAPSSSGASPLLDFKIGGVVIAGLTIGGAAILAL